MTSPDVGLSVVAAAIVVIAGILKYNPSARANGVVLEKTCEARREGLTGIMERIEASVKDLHDKVDKLKEDG